MAIASARFSARATIQLEPAMRQRLERLARARRAKFSQVLREAIDVGLPILEGEVVDRKLGSPDLAAV
jgi:predicted transcriptional regulator